MYLNNIKVNDTSVNLYVDDYDLFGYMLYDSANKIIELFDSVIQDRRDVQLETCDLLSENFLSYLRVRYKYIRLSYLYNDSWGQDEY
jgi:hypothetical protein